MKIFSLKFRILNENFPTTKTVRQISDRLKFNRGTIVPDHDATVQQKNNGVKSRRTVYLNVTGVKIRKQWTVASIGKFSAGTGHEANLELGN